MDNVSDMVVWFMAEHEPAGKGAHEADLVEIVYELENKFPHQWAAHVILASEKIEDLGGMRFVVKNKRVVTK